MPSPFPGMDPYLEKPSSWADVHHELISEIRAALAAILRPKYFVRVEERVYVAEEFDPGRGTWVPDVHVSKSSSTNTGSPSKLIQPATDDVVAIEVESFVDFEVHESRLTIYDSESRAVVTVIEILSPSNKTLNAAGRENYLAKRHDVLHSSSHLVEIDLLRTGVSIGVRDRFPACEYLVQVSKRVENDRRRTWAWPIQLKQRLPKISIPLHAGDADATLDLQAVLNSAYERGGYDLAIDYSKDPSPPLDPALTEWARAVVQAKR